MTRDNDVWSRHLPVDVETVTSDCLLYTSPYVGHFVLTLSTIPSKPHLYSTTCLCSLQGAHVAGTEPPLSGPLVAGRTRHHQGGPNPVPVVAGNPAYNKTRLVHKLLSFSLLVSTYGNVSHVVTSELTVLLLTPLAMCGV